MIHQKLYGMAFPMNDQHGRMSIEQWLSDADTALYDAKASGRNRVRLANEHSLEAAQTDATHAISAA